jgi:hypothetical protein
MGYRITDRRKKLKKKKKKEAKNQYLKRKMNSKLQSEPTITSFNADGIISR